MRKYLTTFTVAIPALIFSGMSWADNVGVDMDSDIVHGHGTVISSPGEAYVASESRSNQTGTDLVSNPQDVGAGSPRSPAVTGVNTTHDDHDDMLHAITKH